MTQILIRIIVVIGILVVGLIAYVRLAPTDSAKWHQLATTDAPGDLVEEGGFRAVRQITAEPAIVLAEVERIALATPRTRLIAGSVAEGMMTFQTRSLVWGFPDHTTVAVQGELLVIYGRLRFGRSDMGVNGVRVRDWLDQLGPLTVGA